MELLECQKWSFFILSELKGLRDLQALIPSKSYGWKPILPSNLWLITCHLVYEIRYFGKKALVFSLIVSRVIGKIKCQQSFSESLLKFYS